MLTRLAHTHTPTHMHQINANTTFYYPAICAQDRKPVTAEPRHDLSSKKTAEKIMEEAEKNHPMEELMEAY